MKYSRLTVLQFLAISFVRSLVRRKLLLEGGREKEKGETHQESVGQFVSSGSAGGKTVTGGKERN